MHKEVIAGDKINPQKKEIKFGEVAELREPTMRILDQIHERIENGEYGIIIGDDASGRIPAIIIGGVIREILRGINGVIPRITYIPGKLKPFHLELESNIKDFLNKFDYVNGKRILVVTDTIRSGGSLQALVKTLEYLTKSSVDIATIGIEMEDDPGYANDRKISLGEAEIISGHYFDNERFLHNTPLIYRAKEMSGVVKDSSGKPISSRRIKDTEYPEEARVQQIIVSDAREDARLLIEELTVWYKQKYEEQK